MGWLFGFLDFKLYCCLMISWFYISVISKYHLLVSLVLMGEWSKRLVDTYAIVALLVVSFVVNVKFCIALTKILAMVPPGFGSFTGQSKMVL